MQIAIVTLFIFAMLTTTRFAYVKKQNNLKFQELTNQLSKYQKLPITLPSKGVPSKKKNPNILNIEVSSKILKGLDELEKKQYYLNEDCNTFNTAKKLKTNVTYLSKTIQHHYGCNFNSYINNLRINHVLKRLNEDSIFRSYSIEAISKEVGYKSVSSFVKHFKKQTQLLPSYYIKKLNS